VFDDWYVQFKFTLLRNPVNTAGLKYTCS